MTKQSHYWAYTLKKIIIERDVCTPMFVAAVLTVGRIWKPPRCPSTDEWIQKLWYIHIMNVVVA